MAAGQKWTYEETCMAFALYFLIGPSKADGRNPDVQALARTLDRSPASVALKITNIAAFDINRTAQGRVGMSHGSKLDAGMWEDYAREGEPFLDRALDLLDNARQGGVSIEFDSLASVERGLEDVPQSTERRALVRQRINQGYFRDTLLHIYQGKCCLTGISCPELLVASHIKPWAACETSADRLTARNGLLLNALHDRAFDRGLMTIDKGYRMRVSRRVGHSVENDRWLWAFDGERIVVPDAYRPAYDFIEYHNDIVFLR